jgi:A/G-specific adenine glycosylase
MPKIATRFPRLLVDATFQKQTSHCHSYLQTMAIKTNDRSADVKRGGSTLGSEGAALSSTCCPPARVHTREYHRPLLLDNRDAGLELLTWFDSIHEQRQMPWRKPWLSQAAFKGAKDDFLRTQAKRAYEIWVSEIMLQQTRVAVVIPYFNKWIAKWPTVEDLAAANHDEVLAAWKGLGYYSRATRLHEAAQQIVQDMRGRLPSDVKGLLRIKGIGPYTAGAVSSIAFGRAVPLLDGNVARVLCRQLGLHGRVKEKKVDEYLWDIAADLVEFTAQHEHCDDASSVPGRWNQALMELGSTVCTPRPKCNECPIKSTCHAFAEGQLLAQKADVKRGTSQVVEVEDICRLCEPLDVEDIEDAAEDVLSEQQPTHEETGKAKKRKGSVTKLSMRPAKVAKVKQGKQRSLRDFAAFASSDQATTRESPPFARERQAQITGYCSLFPKREPKKTVREEECIVCIIRLKSDARDEYLIEQRPPKGLLASLWEFPTYTISNGTEMKAKERKLASEAFVRDLIKDAGHGSLSDATEIGMTTHVFSHLKLHMHVHTFLLERHDRASVDLVTKDVPKRAWVKQGGVQDATLGTGVRRCWEKFLGVDTSIGSTG